MPGGGGKKSSPSSLSRGGAIFYLEYEMRFDYEMEF